MNRLSLSEALASGRLKDFISQAEADGIGLAVRAYLTKESDRG